MRLVTALSRRRFLGAILVLVGPARRAAANNGPLVVKVTIRDFGFEPETLTVASGDSVEWINLDLAPHTATAATGRWVTSEIARGARTRITFAEAGEHGYLCAFHPHMTGRISVGPRADG